jgi:GNAT superfamily N-acetyltransferase
MEVDLILDVKIRRAVRADVEQIVRIGNNGGPNNRPRELLPEFLPSGYFEAFDRIDRDANQLLMIAEMDGRVIGTFHLTFLTYLVGAGKEDCQVESVHVAEEWRGKGIGKQMMNWAIDTAKRRGCRRVQLTTDKQRLDAHRFYRGLGFTLSHEGAKLSLLP